MTRHPHFITLTALALSLSFVACGGASSDADSVAVAVEAAATTSAALTGTAEVVAPLGGVSDQGASTAAGIERAFSNAMRCAQVANGGGVVTVDFGEGCTVNGSTLAGSFTVAATRTNASFGFSLTLDDLSKDGNVHWGNVTASASQGVLAIDASLMSSHPEGSAAVTFSGTATADGAAVIVDAIAAHDDGEHQSSMVATALRQNNGECYPSSGTILVSSADQPDILVTFSSETPSTGIVSVKVGRAPAQDVALPERNNCPR